MVKKAAKAAGTRVRVRKLVPCKTSHIPEKKAQYGCNGYCIMCFKKKFPAEYVKWKGNKRWQNPWCKRCQLRFARSGYYGYCEPCSKKELPHRWQNPWCKTPHFPKKLAVSGNRGYCISCFKKKFPQEYAEKNERRKQNLKHCVICSAKKDLIQKQFCKPCYRARSCERCD